MEKTKQKRKPENKRRIKRKKRLGNHGEVVVILNPPHN